MSCSVIRIPYNGGLIFGRALLSGGGGLLSEGILRFKNVWAYNFAYKNITW